MLLFQFLQMFDEIDSAIGYIMKSKDIVLVGAKFVVETIELLKELEHIRWLYENLKMIKPFYVLKVWNFHDCFHIISVTYPMTINSQNEV